MAFLRVVVAFLLFGFSLRSLAGEPEYQEPAGNINEWGEKLFMRRLEAAKKQGKDEAVRFVQQELAEQLYPCGQFKNEALLNFLKENGGPDSLPLLEEWLSLPPLGFVLSALRKRNVDDTNYQAGRAWYEVSKRQCKTREGLLSLVTGVFTNDPIGYAIGNDYVVEDMRGLLPESRVKMYKMLLNKDLFYYRVPAKEVIENIVFDPAFQPKPEEIEGIWKQGGSLGRMVLVRLNFIKNASDVDAFWETCKSSPEHVERIQAYEYFARRGPEGVSALIAHLKALRQTPLSERNEEELYQGTGGLTGVVAMARALPASEKKEMEDYAKWVLETSPALENRDLSIYWDKPGTRPRTTEAEGIRGSRKSLRDAAEQLQRYCAEKK